MLDLEKLEKQLDEALAKETNESLTRWLLDIRAKNLSCDDSYALQPKQPESMHLNLRSSKKKLLSHIEPLGA
jgi:hypothetical protein